MVSKLIGLAVILALGFMIFRPRHGNVGHAHHEDDPESSARDDNSTAKHTKKGGGCCG